MIAGPEAAIPKGRAGVSPRIDFDHDVSILITAVDAADHRDGCRYGYSPSHVRPPFGLLPSKSRQQPCPSEAARPSSASMPVPAALRSGS